ATVDELAAGPTNNDPNQQTERTTTLPPPPLIGPQHQQPETPPQMPPPKKLAKVLIGVHSKRLHDCVNVNTVRWWMAKLHQFRTDKKKLKEILFYMPDTVWNFMATDSADERWSRPIWDPFFVKATLKVPDTNLYSEKQLILATKGTSFTDPFTGSS
ncbi:unnamed protein product, partial [Amoebophrya sp. A120]